MPRFPIDERQCNALVALPKTIRSNITWIQRTNRSYIYSRVPVEGDFEGQLELIVTVNVEEPSIFSITLLYNAAHRIRGLDVLGSHTNKCSDGLRWNGQTHKHTWSDTCPSGHAYTPTNIAGNTLAEVFREFCAECNIDFRGQLIPPPTQPQLPGI